MTHREKQVTNFAFPNATCVLLRDGNSNAERYYANVRPQEGLPRIHYPSKTAVSGYKFHN